MESTNLSPTIKLLKREEGVIVCKQSHKQNRHLPILIGGFVPVSTKSKGGLCS